MGMRLGNYEVLGELGHGSFARVYRARGPRGEVVAIKLLSAKADDAYARFAREQRLLETLGEAEGFVPLIEAGIAEQGPFFVMPLLAGGTLRDRLAGGRLPIEETLQLGRRLATAIGWAHERGIVHRDLKPENILFTTDRRPLVADLGIAKHFVDSTSVSESITERGAFLGTPVYMAPEQMDCSKSVDGRADVYALGAILYECLAGRPPFDGATIHEMIARLTRGDYTHVEEERKETPLYLSHPIRVALNQDPELRYEDGFAFGDALGARIPQRARLNATVSEPPRTPRRRPRTPFVAAAALVAASVLLVLATRDAKRPGETPLSSNTASVKSDARTKPVAKGWAGEPLPAGLRCGTNPPVYVFDSKKGLELELVYVPPGDFFMGAINGGQHEKPLHMHPMPRSYYMARTEVTWADYERFCQATGRAEPARPSWPMTPLHPVVNVSWFDATAFCEWAGMALPTEAEWEKAARGAADTRQWPWGDDWVEGAANILETSGRETGGSKEPSTAPVGSFLLGVSPYGVLDMAGNVFEWTADYYDASIYLEYSNGRVDPPSTGSNRVMRGGSWRESRFAAAATFRRLAMPEWTADHLGFRPCLRTGK